MTRIRLLSIPLVLFVLCASLPETADAQRRSARTSDKQSSQASRSTKAKSPLEEARAMRKARRSARQAARALERRWDQTPLDAAKTLREAGYSPREIAAAYRGHRQVTRDEVPGLLVATGLSPRAAISAAEARSFRDPVFGTVDLDCVGPNGLPVPCGIQGGPPAMGSLSWSPMGQGEVGEILTIESTNIPAVSVRLAGRPLELLEATSSRIRARLPSQPTTGDLVLVRESDGQEGLVESGYRVTQAPDLVKWPVWSDAAYEASLEEAQRWIDAAKIDESRCRVEGPIAIGTPGVLTSDYRFDGLIRKALLAEGAPREVAAGWQRAFERSWTGWSDEVTIPGLPFYPPFASWPAAEAPPTPNVPMPLVTLVSSGLTSMSTPGAIQQSVETRIGHTGSGPAREEAIEGYATRLAMTFTGWIPQAQVSQVMGHGELRAPGGPVEGSCFTDETGPFTTGPPFDSARNVGDAYQGARQRVPRVVPRQP